MNITLQAKGIKETVEYLKEVSDKLTGPDVRQGMKDATMKVAADAKRNAPVDTGHLRKLITPSVMGGKVMQGVVGSNVRYAPFMELGTKPHWPPLSALETWARRHNIPVFLVARAIARRGLKPRRFLQSAFEKNAQWIYRRFEEIVRRTIGK